MTVYLKRVSLVQIKETELYNYGDDVMVSPAEVVINKIYTIFKSLLGD